MGWLMGWRNGKQIYELFYDEELSRLIQESKSVVDGTVEETIEEKIQKALWERLR